MRKVAYLTLGCDKNRVDTERTLKALADAGFEPVPAPAPAHALVINTCGFIDAAKEESIEAIMEAVRVKEHGGYELLAVVGCLVERYRKELEAEIPEVDIFMGLEHVAELAAALGKIYGPGHPAAGVCTDPFPRILTTPPHYAFLKIGDGCSSACRFCAIPAIRGGLHSEPMDGLLGEARALEASGVKEICLVAQDTTAYGRDLEPRVELADLVERILAETKIPWIRILYAHPEHVTDRLVDLLAGEERLLRYLDLPLQHISDTMLAKMGRKPGRKGIEALLDKLERRVRGLVLRTSFLVGFPGEGGREFEEIISFIEEGRFFWASGFAFSAQEGTAAEKMPDQVDPAAADQRLGLIFDAQREITAGKLAGLVGRELEVLVDGKWIPLIQDEPFCEERQAQEPIDPERPPLEWTARFSGQAIEVDGVVRLFGKASPGELTTAVVTASWDYDLEARLKP